MTGTGANAPTGQEAHAPPQTHDLPAGGNDTPTPPLAQYARGPGSGAGASGSTEGSHRHQSAPGRRTPLGMRFRSERATWRSVTRMAGDSDVGEPGLDEGAAGGGGHPGVFTTLPHVAVQGGELGQGQGLGGTGQLGGLFV